MINEIIKKNGITYGVITGVLSILITTSIYVIDISLFTSVWIGLVSMAIFIIIGIVLLSKTKKELNGVFSFKQAFTTYFISAVIGILISVAFNVVLFNLVDPSAKEIIKENSIKSIAETMQKYNAPASTVNDAIAKLQDTDQFAPLEQLKGSVFSILFSALFGLILAAFFKSKNSSRE
jgi:glucan phosphoethanolaminetransferase (alkaline phosphatase superfamily)